MENDFEIIATINTNGIDKLKLLQFVEHGTTIFRINSSFLPADDIKQKVAELRDIFGSSVRILIDLPGYKIRFLFLDKDIAFKANSEVVLKKEYFNYPDFLNFVEIGAVIRINDGFNTLVVTEKNRDAIICASHGNGSITRGRGMHINNIQYSPLPDSLSRFDLKLIETLKTCDIDYVGLSFIHSMGDVKYVEKRLASSRIKCIPKIEAKESLGNIYTILKESDTIILDRGDLSGEIGLELLWKTQKDIISLSRLLDCRIIIATQVMASMVRNPVPSITEIDSIYNLLSMGINGIQLSEETSIGKHPAECLQFVKNAVKYFKQNHKKQINSSGSVIWLMGMTASGKTTIARKVVEKLKEKNITLMHYDGDEIRDMFGGGHGFSEEDRFRVVKNLAHLANKSAKEGFNVIISALTAHEKARQYVKESIGRPILVFIRCSADECARRDHKGLYKKAKEGKIDTLIGCSTPYPVPSAVDLTVDTEENSIDESADMIIDFLLENRYVKY